MDASYAADDVPLLQLDVKSQSLLSAKCTGPQDAHEALLAVAQHGLLRCRRSCCQLLPSASPLVGAEREVSSALAHELAGYYAAATGARTSRRCCTTTRRSRRARRRCSSLLALSQLHFALQRLRCRRRQTLTSAC